MTPEALRIRILSDVDFALAHPLLMSVDTRRLMEAQRAFLTEPSAARDAYLAALVAKLG